MKISRSVKINIIKFIPTGFRIQDSRSCKNDQISYMLSDIQVMLDMETYKVVEIIFMNRKLKDKGDLGDAVD